MELSVPVHVFPQKIDPCPSRLKSEKRKLDFPLCRCDQRTDQLISERSCAIKKNFCIAPYHMRYPVFIRKYRLRNFQFSASDNDQHSDRHFTDVLGPIENKLDKSFKYIHSCETPTSSSEFLLLHSVSQQKISRSLGGHDDFSLRTGES